MNPSLTPISSKWQRYFKSYFPPWQNKKVGYWGNFGHGDLGDDACFLAAQDFFGSMVPVSKRCFAFNPAALHTFFIGGGGVFRWESPYIPRRLLLKKKWPFPIILLSAGINCDYRQEFSEETREKIKKLCDICDYISVRDNLTERFLNKMGVSDIQIIPDLELILQDQQKSFDYEKQGFTVGVVLTPHSEFGDDTFQKIKQEFVKFSNFLTDRDCQVLFLPFDHASSESEREKSLITEILNSVKDRSKVGALSNDMHPGEMLFAIRKFCDFMVCMRMHSMVFALNAGIPFFCIGYNQMHRGFLEMVGRGDLEISLFEDFSSEMLEFKFENMMQDYDGIREKMVKKRNELQEQVREGLSFIKSQYLTASLTA